jgi:GTP cyclohydrolase II
MITPRLLRLNKVAEVNLPTHWAQFRLLAFEAAFTCDDSRRERIDTGLALQLGDIDRSIPLVRIHSQCTTGEVLHSLRCDCHDQLHLALSRIAGAGSGLLLYECQEGRGIGLMEKLRAYQLQDQGLDTVEANLRLGHAVDLRDYSFSIEVLRFLRIRAIRLMTNNPEKIRAVVASGVTLVERVSADVPGNPHSASYLATKRQKLGHLSESWADVEPRANIDIAPGEEMTLS